MCRATKSGLSKLHIHIITNLWLTTKQLLRDKAYYLIENTIDLIVHLNPLSNLPQPIILILCACFHRTLTP